MQNNRRRFVLKITQKMVEDILYQYDYPLDSATITRALTGQQLALAAEDGKVRRHLAQLSACGIATVVAKDEDGEFIYMPRRRLTDAHFTTARSVYMAVKNNHRPMSAWDIADQVFANEDIAKYMLGRVQMALAMWLKSGVIVKDDVPENPLFSLKKPTSRLTGEQLEALAGTAQNR